MLLAVQEINKRSRWHAHHRHQIVRVELTLCLTSIFCAFREKMRERNHFIKTCNWFIQVRKNVDKAVESRLTFHRLSFCPSTLSLKLFPHCIVEYCDPCSIPVCVHGFYCCVSSVYWKGLITRRHSNQLGCCSPIHSLLFAVCFKVRSLSVEFAITVLQGLKS